MRPYPGQPYQGSYNQMGFHQNYERLQPGADQQYFAGDPRSPQHATVQSFTSRYYDGAGGGDELWPKPIGLLGRQNPAESFQSVALSEPPEPGPSPEERPAPPRPKPQPKQFVWYVNYVRDHLFLIILFFGVVMVAVCSLYLLVCVVNTCLMDAFSTFSSLAWESYFTSFWAIMVICAVLAVFSFAAAAWGVNACLKEKKEASKPSPGKGAKNFLRTFISASATLSFIILALALFSWLYGLRARPYVVRAANLICQETDVWRCEKGATPQDAPPGRRLNGVLDEARMDEVSTALQEPVIAAEHALSGLVHSSTSSASSVARRLAGATAGQVATSFLSHFEDGQDSGRVSAAARRLNTAAKAVMAFEEGLSKEPAVGGVTGVCRMVNELCTKKPVLFSASTSCVCNGQWDYAPKDSNVTSTSPKARSGDTDKTRRLASESAAGTGVAAALRKLQADPWQGSIGDYCDNWSGDADGDWCFVSSQQQCDVVGQNEYKTLSGVVLTRSQGPCTDEVDSRSQYILDGLDAMLWSLRVSAVLGGLLALSALCGGMLYRFPSRNTQEGPVREVGGKKKPDGQSKNAVDEYQQREKLFAIAQEEAVRKLNDDTPEDLKLMLYGFYKQAQEGDVQGDKPPFWNGRERSKYEYWERHRGMTREQAVDGYVSTVHLLSSNNVA